MAMAGEQPDDLDLAIRTVAAETSGRSPQETLAIASTIVNRLKTGKWGSTLGDVVLARNQFEPWNKPGNPNDPMRIDPNSRRYQDAAAAIKAALQGQDPTGGATHFFAPAAQAALGRQPPAWGRSGGKQIGATAFFAPEGRVNSFNSEMTLPTFQNNPIPGTGTGPIQPIGGMVQGNLQNSPGSGGGGSPSPAPPSLGGGGGGGPMQSQPPILGRMLFGDGGLKGFMNSAMPTPFGGQGLLKGGFNAITGAGGAPAAASGGPMMLPGASVAAPAAATTAAAAAPAAASAAAPAAAGASGIGAALSSLLAMI